MPKIQLYLSIRPDCRNMTLFLLSLSMDICAVPSQSSAFNNYLYYFKYIPIISEIYSSYSSYHIHTKTFLEACFYNKNLLNANSAELIFYHY